MKCRESQYWLYSFQPNAAWPADVVAHLQDCHACQQLQGQLRQIDQGINKLTTMPANEAPVAQLLRRIEKAPVVKLPTPSQPTAWLRFGAYLTGAAALIAFGWVLGRFGEPVEAAPIEVIKTVFRDNPVEVIRERTVEVFRDKLVPVHSQSERSLFATLLKRNAHLVQTAIVDDRIDTLLDMANDCRQHALTLIADGPRDSLPLTIDLYAQLLRDGVLVQLVQAPAADRPALRTAVRTRLLKMADADIPKTPIKVLADQRDTLENATLQTVERLDQLEGVIVVKKPRKGTGYEPLLPPNTALVQFAITYSSETNPVLRADFCADYVRRLMPSVMLYLADDAVPQRAEMGQQFGDMIQFGIYRPLETATAQEPAPPLKAQAERIFQNTGQAIAEMEKNLQQAPVAAKAGLQRALDSARKHPGKGKGASKGKGSGKGSRGGQP